MLLLKVGDLVLESLDPVAAVVADRLSDLVALATQRAALLGEPVDARRPALDLGIEACDPLDEEPALELREPGAERFATAAQLLERSSEFRVPFSVKMPGLIPPPLRR
jgi:hypothetical protein